MLKHSDPNRESWTVLPIMTADGGMLPPVLVLQGAKAAREADEVISQHFDGKAQVIGKPKSHMMDSDTWCEALRHLATAIPGGVSPTNRFLLLADGV